MADNIPRVTGEHDHQRFFDAVKKVVDILTGKNTKAKYDRALTVRDLEKLNINGTSIDMDKFLACDKQNPYEL